MLVVICLIITSIALNINVLNKEDVCDISAKLRHVITRQNNMFRDDVHADPSVIMNETFASFSSSMVRYNVAVSGSGGDHKSFHMFLNHPKCVKVEDDGLILSSLLSTEVLQVDWGGESVVRGESVAQLWRKGCTDNSYHDSGFAGCGPFNREAQMKLPCCSGMLDTKGKFAFMFGRVEVEAKLPTSRWVESFIKLIPEGNIYGLPTSVDIMKSMGNKSGDVTVRAGEASVGELGNDYFTSCVSLLDHNYLACSYDPDFTTDYHIFGLNWSEDEFYTYYRTPGSMVEHKVLDLHDVWGKEKLVCAHKDTIYAPFHTPFYLSIGLSVGGEQFNHWSEYKHKYGDSSNPAGAFLADEASWIESWETNAGFRIKSINVFANESTMFQFHSGALQSLHGPNT
jgi:hypothetical protein